MGFIGLAPTAITPCCKLLPGGLQAAFVKTPFAAMDVAFMT
jgi:hypothetical protein